MSDKERYEKLLAIVEKHERDIRYTASCTELDLGTRAFLQARLQRFAYRKPQLKRAAETGEPIYCQWCGTNPISIERLEFDPLYSECEACRSEKLAQSRGRLATSVGLG